MHGKYWSKPHTMRTFMEYSKSCSNLLRGMLGLVNFTMWKWGARRILGCDMENLPATRIGIGISKYLVCCVDSACCSVEPTSVKFTIKNWVISMTPI